MRPSFRWLVVPGFSSWLTDILTNRCFPALNTVFVGMDRDLGWFEENCRTCGECVLGETGGICPVTRCAKSLFNGPCGGTSREGKCEVSKDTPCAWFEIHKRLKEQNRLENILKVKPAREWRNQTRGIAGSGSL